MSGQTIRVALLGYDGVQTLDLCGPLDAFGSANAMRRGGYTTTVVTLDDKGFTSEAGLRVTPDCALADAGPLDTLILPGGEGLRRPGVAVRIAKALRDRAPNLRRLVSICTGIYGLAPSGLADGCRVTTHWKFVSDVASRFPAIQLTPDAIFIKDGLIYSSAGITAAIDVTLALIEEDYGPQVRIGSCARPGRLRETFRRTAAIFRAAALPGSGRRPLCRSGRLDGRPFGTGSDSRNAR